MSFLDDWWEERRAEVRAELRAAGVGADLSAEPAYPAFYGHTGAKHTSHPWSAVVGAREKLPKQINLGTMRYHLGLALGLTKKRETNEGHGTDLPKSGQEAVTEAAGASTEAQGQEE